ncbi:MAG: host specificity factor TipJ family phage tail protein [Rhodoglobus sp.]|nr:host specificity factor TipJ family phage tail protein [Rhodoglobus sp.]
MGLGLKKIGKKLGKAFKFSTIGLFYEAHNLALSAAAKYLRKKLMPKIPSQETGSASQAYNIDGRQNVLARNGPQNEHFGIGRRWPEYKSQPFNYFHNDVQVLCQLLFISVGDCEIDDLRVGQTPFSAYPDAVSELYGPGVPVTLFHPNVFTNDQVGTVELKPGALETAVIEDGSIEFEVDGRIHGVDDRFKRGRVGSTLTVSGTISYNGTYNVIGVDGSGDSIYTDATFVAGTEAGTITFDRFNDSGSVLRVDGLSLTTSAAPNRFTAPVDAFIDFRVGDVVTTVDASTNDAQNFTITAKAGDASYLELDIAPSAVGSYTADVVLLRRWQGSYAVCPPFQTVDQISVDVQSLQGLAKLDVDDTKPYTDSIVVQTRLIDDVGAPLGAFDSHAFDVTAAKRDPVRRTIDIAIAAGRYEVRVARVSPKSNDSRFLDSMEWCGLKGYIVEPVGETHDTFAGCTVVATQLTASGQLSGQEASDINMLVKRKLPAWNGATFTAAAVTDSIAWAHLYILQKCGIPDAEIDLDAHLTAHTAWAARGWTFTHDFDSETNVQEARRTVLRCGRATPTRNPITGKYGFRRDEPRAPTQMFTDQNSDTGDYSGGKVDGSTATGMVMEYMDAATWTSKELPIGDTDEKPARDRLNGCTSRQHAWDILYFEWYSQRYRNRSIPLDAEMEPALLQYDDAVLIQSAEQRWGQGTRLVSVAGSVLTVAPAVSWGGTGHHVYLRGPGGAPGAQISVTQGTGPDKIVLGSPADVELVTGDDEERTYIAFGSSAVGSPVIALTRGVTWEIGDNGGLRASIETVLEDARVFADPGDPPD